MKLSKAQCEAYGILPPPKGGGSKYTGFDLPLERRIAKAKLANTDAEQGRDKLFDAACKAHGLPVPVHEFEFHPTRKWRFDFLFDGWLAVELQGGLFTEGRHTQGAALLKEYEKLNAAQIMGYTMLLVTPEQVDSGEAFTIIKRALEAQ
jgi:hypothetical protein